MFFIIDFISLDADHYIRFLLARVLKQVKICYKNIEEKCC